jgi:hypothetical protein
MRRDYFPSWNQMLWAVLCLVLCQLGVAGKVYGQSAGSRQSASPVISTGRSPFLVAPSFSVSGAPTSVAAGDLNGDGKLDLVITKSGSNNVTVLLGTGDGHFAAGGDYAAGNQPGSVQIGDLNGDGRLDVVVSNRATGAVNVLLGNGDGTLGKSTEYTSVTDAVSVAIGNFNGNGKIDLAVAGSSSQTIAVLLNDGMGHFLKAVPFNIGHQSQSLTVTDLNGDGHADIVSANNDGTISALLGSGKGAFQQVHSSNVASGSLSGVAAGDFNGDGKIDLAVSQSGTNQLTVLFGRGDGSFQPGVPYTVGNNPASVIVADVNGDGVPDLVAANESGNTFSVLAGNGDGTFKPSLDFTVGNSPRALIAGDFNGDGHTDLAVLNYLDGTVSVPLGNGDGTFQAARAYKADLERKAIATGDLDGNGSPDLVVTNYCGNNAACKSNGTVTVFLAGSDGSYRAAASYPVGNGPVAVALADFNGDGKLDLVALNRIDKTYTVTFGNGDGTFGAPLTYQLGKSPLALVVGDFNKDGKADLAISSDCGASSCTQPGEIDVLLGHGDGSFAASATYPVGYSPSSLALGDLNGDGIPDLAVANACGEDGTCKSPGTAILLAGNGTGKFTQTGEINIGNSPSSIAIDSLSGSGVNLVVASSTDNQVSVLQSDGKGGFKAPVTYPVGAGPSSVAVADFNGDGRKDVAVANFSTSTVSVLFGNGDGTLQMAVPYSVGTGPESLVAVSAKKAGPASLVSANGNNGSTPMGTDITVLANVQPEDLIPSVTSLTASPTSSVVSQPVTLTATVTGNGETPPTGSVTFTGGTTSLSDCNGGTSSSVPLDPTTGTAVCVTALMPLGSDTVTASYSGDSTYDLSSGTTTQTVTAASTSTTVSTSGSPSTVNGQVTFTSTTTVVAPGTGAVSLSGSVTFVDSLNSFGCTNVAINPSTGTAGCTISTMSAGAHIITATYSNDLNYVNSSGTVGQTVNKAATNGLLTSSANPSNVNDQVGFVLTVTTSGTQSVPFSNSPTITFKDGSNSVGCTVGWIPAGGKATCATSSLAEGSHTITATYSGDPNYSDPTVNSVIQVVNPIASSTALTSSANPSSVNQSVTFTATVTPSNGAVPLTGTVTFTDNSAPAACTVAWNAATGVATCSTASLTGGSHTILATYAGDPSYTTSNKSLAQTVNTAASSTTVTSSSPASTVNTSVTFTATVTPSASAVKLSGSVTFTDNGSAIAACATPVAVNPSTGIATCTTSALAAGTHSIVATYASDPNYTTSNNNVTQTVNAAASSITLSSSLNPSMVNQAVTFTATVTPITGPVKLSGTVSFTDNGSPLASCPVSFNPATGVATCSTSSLSLGSHTIVATYTDANYTSSSASVTQTVGPATTTLALKSSANPSTINESVTLTATITAAAGNTPLSGKVTFTDNANPVPECATPVGVNPATGVAVCTTVSLTLGSHSIVATYGSDNNFSGSSNSLTQIVNPATTTTTLTSSTAGDTSVINQSINFTATVSAASGAVKFSGTMTFTDNGNPLPGCSLPVGASSGVAICSTAALTKGSHTIVATYANDTNFGGSSNTLTQTVNAAPSTTTLTSMLNPSIVKNPNNFNDAVNLTAAVTPISGPVLLSGTVTFTDNGNAIPECLNAVPVAPATGLATCTTVSLTFGSHTISAVYGGDQNFLSSNNSLVQLVQDYTLSASPTSVVTVTPGFTSLNDPFTPQVTASGQSSITVTAVPISGFTARLGLTCAIDPMIVGSPKCTLGSATFPITSNAVQQPVTIVIDASSASTTPGQYSVSVTGTDPVTGLSRSTAPFTVIVRQVGMLALGSGTSTGVGAADFVLPPNVGISNFTCPLLAGPTLTSTVNPAALFISCSSFSPTSVPPSATGQTATVMVTVNTNVNNTAQLTEHTGLFAAGLVGIPVLALIGFLRGGKSTRKSFFRILGIFAVFVALLQGIGCGGSFSRPPNPTGNQTPVGVYYLLIQSTGTDAATYEAVLQVVVTR